MRVEQYVDSLRSATPEALKGISFDSEDLLGQRLVWRQLNRVDFRPIRGAAQWSENCGALRTEYARVHSNSFSYTSFYEMQPNTFLNGLRHRFSGGLPLEFYPFALPNVFLSLTVTLQSLVAESAHRELDGTGISVQLSLGAAATPALHEQRDLLSARVDIQYALLARKLNLPYVSATHPYRATHSPRLEDDYVQVEQLFTNKS
jgi:hypothetical protein